MHGVRMPCTHLYNVSSPHLFLRCRHNSIPPVKVVTIHPISNRPLPFSATPDDALSRSCADGTRNSETAQIVPPASAIRHSIHPAVRWAWLPRFVFMVCIGSCIAGMPLSSSSVVTQNSSLIRTILPTSGIALPLSHLETAWRETPSDCASCSCDKPCSLRRR